MNSGFKKKLEEAKDNSRKVKLMFQYPGSPRAVKKSGSVMDIFDDSFIMEEKYDGECVYSYNFLVEISYDNEGDINDNGGHVDERRLGRQHGPN